MIPSPILKALSTIRTRRVDHLLMGGQACVLYGAAEFSRDVDPATCQGLESGALARALHEEEDAERSADAAYWQLLRQRFSRLRREARRSAKEVDRE